MNFISKLLSSKTTYKAKPAVKKPFKPYYGGVGGKMSNGVGWGGEVPLKEKKKALNMLKKGMQGKKR